MRRLVLVLAALAIAVPAVAGTLAGVTLPDSISVGGRTLALNGMGVRTKVFFKVYVGGLYLEKKTTDAAEVIQSDAARRLVLQFVRDVDRNQITEAFDESVRNNAAAQAASLKAEVAQFLAALEPFKSGEQMTITYLPGTGTTISVKGADKVTIPGLPFGQLVFSMWLGPKPPSGDLKKGLLGIR
ncbi:MAG TPA: chalcone isomerase family protein [Vicinamibacterales bacterium]|nr:chalcone isomerase family protein [Acidobacteriota bacterium]HOC17826.1 chalcone isomerase family protein [Vicinamibacterales bacterium]